MSYYNSSILIKDNSNGCYKSVFDKDPNKALNFIEAFACLEKVTDLVASTIYSRFDTLSIGDRYIKAKSELKKKQKNKKDTFKSRTYKEPKSAYLIFKSEYLSNHGEKVPASEIKKKWDKEMTESDKSKYIKQYEKNKKVYNKNVESEKINCIYNGTFEPHHIKKLNTSYIIFGGLFREGRTDIIKESWYKEWCNITKDTVDDGSTVLGQKGKYISSLWNNKVKGTNNKIEQKIKEIYEHQKQINIYKNYERDIIIIKGKLRNALYNELTKVPKYEITELRNDLKHALKHMPDGYREYVESDEYEPLYNFETHIENYKDDTQELLTKSKERTKAINKQETEEDENNDDDDNDDENNNDDDNDDKNNNEEDENNDDEENEEHIIINKKSKSKKNIKNSKKPTKIISLSDSDNEQITINVKHKNNNKPEKSDSQKNKKKTIITLTDPDDIDISNDENSSDNDSNKEIISEDEDDNDSIVLSE